MAGVEVANAYEHFDRQTLCCKLRWSTGKVSPRFSLNQVYYNRKVIVARDYLIVKTDRNHAYHITAFLPDSVLVDSEEGYGYQQFFTDGKKGKLYMSIPSDSKRTILQVRQLGLKRL